MKSILVIDTPKTCKECPCQLMLVCVPADEDIDEYINPSETKPDWCPLRPLPQKKNECYYFGELVKNEFAVGFNACLEKITGETE